MSKKYGKSPQQRLDEALKQVMPNFPDVLPQSGNAKVFDSQDLNKACDKILLDLAMNRIIAELEKSKEPNSYYHLWQNDIAGAFYDMFHATTCGNAHTNVSNMTLMAIANNAAKNFLNSLCSQSKITEQKKPNE